jgi:hypothetical protein
MEFLIQRDDGLPLVLDPALYAEVLRPSSLNCRTVPGWGAHRIEVKGCPILFAFDGSGIAVSFQNWLLTEEEVARVIADIAANVARAVGHPTRVVEN